MVNFPEQRQPVHDLAAVKAAADEIDARVFAALERGVALMRSERRSWSEIGRALGVSRQAAHARWRYVDDRLDRNGNVAVVVRTIDGKRVTSFRSGEVEWTRDDLRLPSPVHVRQLAAAAADVVDGEAVVDHGEAVVDGEAVRR